MRLPILSLLIIAPYSTLAADAEPSHVVTLASPDGGKFDAYLFLPQADAPARRSAVVFLHGGGWRWGTAKWTFSDAERLAAMGFAGLAVEYRLSVDDVTPIEALADACTAIRWMRNNAGEYGVNPEQVVVHGVSAGGQLAAATVTTGCNGDAEAGRADALVLWSPALAVEHDGWFQRLLGERATAEDYSPNLNLNDMLPPTLIVHGEADTLTPIRGSRDFCTAVRAAGSRCELKAYAGLGHLLTRNLEQQERDFDIDPAAAQDGDAVIDRFIVEFDSQKTGKD